MISVLDASAPVRVAMDPGSPFRAALKEADLVIAPELIVPEVCSAFRKYVRARAMSWAEATALTGQALALVDDLQPMRELVPEVLVLASGTEASVYDLFYLALAKKASATLLTADVALRQYALKMGVGAPVRFPSL